MLGLITVTPVDDFMIELALDVVVVVGRTTVTPPVVIFLPVLASVSRGDVESAWGFDRTAKILPSGVRMYTPLGVRITSTC